MTVMCCFRLTVLPSSVLNVPPLYTGQFVSFVVNYYLLVFVFDSLNDLFECVDNRNVVDLNQRSCSTPSPVTT